MALIAAFRLYSPDDPLTDVVRSVAGCEITVLHEEQTVSGMLVHLIRLERGSPDAFEAALETAEYVSEVALVSDDESTRTYHVVSDGPFPEEMDELRLTKTHIERMRVTADGWHMRQRFANRDEFVAYRESCRKMGAAFHLERLYEATDADGTVLGITEKQHEALLAAYDAGYFAVPRRASLREVAADLDLSRSALAERLHRGQAHLLEDYAAAARH